MPKSLNIKPYRKYRKILILRRDVIVLRACLRSDDFGYVLHSSTRSHMNKTWLTFSTSKMQAGVVVNLQMANKILLFLLTESLLERFHNCNNCTFFLRVK